MPDDLVFDPLSENFRRNSVSIYQRFLKEDPIHKAPDGSWLLCRHKDVKWVLSDRKMFQRPHEWSKSRKPAGPLARFGENNMISMNPPDHTRFRKAMARAFAPKLVTAMGPSVERTTDRIIEAMKQVNSGDFIELFALPLPVAVICDLMQIPVEDHEVFGEHTQRLIAALEISATEEEVSNGADSAQRLFDYLKGVIEDRANNLGDDLISAMIGHEQDDNLTRDEVIWAAVTLLIAGHETTTHLIGNGLLALLNNRDQYDLLANDTSLAENAVEEFLRIDPSLYVLFREPKEDIEIDGNVIKKGERINVSLAAANRDPAVFNNPNSLDIRRENAKDHFTFAAGIHTCLGASLARLEGKIAFTKLFENFEDFQLAGTAEPRNGLMFKGYKSIPITWKNK